MSLRLFYRGDPFAFCENKRSDKRTIYDKGRRHFGGHFSEHTTRPPAVTSALAASGAFQASSRSRSRLDSTSGIPDVPGRK